MFIWDLLFESNFFEFEATDDAITIEIVEISSLSMEAEYVNSFNLNVILFIM